MCGIVGFVDFKKETSEQHLGLMANVLTHRGPDDMGTFLDLNDGFTLGLGHKRLSILDLSPLGHQPMQWQDLLIVYNGEVYNFKEIRVELQSIGYTFESNSDTEVILKGFHAWGMKIISRLNGMFAIAFYDKKNKKLTLIRDRAGVKPIYWYNKDGLFMFASELKSFFQHPKFEKDIDFSGLSLFLQYGYINQPNSIFKHTQKLAAGHYLELDLKTGGLVIHQYWDVLDQYIQEKSQENEHEILNSLDNLLESACNYRMVSDVPVGVFLSGGYDSSLVAAMVQKRSMKKVKTFTIGFEDSKFDEAPFAKKVAEHLGTDHQEYHCTQKDALEVLDKLVYNWDEPFADSSAIPTLLVSKMARESVTVSLSADGGDELFGGYEKYSSALTYEKLNSFLPVRGIIDCGLAPLRNFMVDQRILSESKLYIFDNLLSNSKSQFAVDYLQNYQKFFLDSELKHLSTQLTSQDLHQRLNPKFALIHDPLDQMMALDYLTYQAEVILTKVDRATMAYSLEGREPLLDYRLLEFVSKLPVDLKVKNGIKKYLLKEVVHRYLPKSLMDRPKMGFSIPLVTWLSNDLKDQVGYYLGDAFILKQGIFNLKAVQLLVLRFQNRLDINYANKIWNVLIFQMWYSKWILNQ
jgi:asparagine synthase (glutamine-hydrolysing)